MPFSQRLRNRTRLARARPPAITIPTSRISRSTFTSYFRRRSGVVRYSGKWKASTDRTARPPSVRAMIPVILPRPTSRAPDWRKTAVGFFRIDVGFMAPALVGTLLHRSFSPLAYRRHVMTAANCVVCIVTHCARGGERHADRLQCAHHRSADRAGQPGPDRHGRGGAGLRLRHDQRPHHGAAQSAVEVSLYRDRRVPGGRLGRVARAADDRGLCRRADEASFASSFRSWWCRTARPC